MKTKPKFVTFLNSMRLVDSLTTCYCSQYFNFKNLVIKCGINMWISYAIEHWRDFKSQLTHDYNTNPKFDLKDLVVKRNFIDKNILDKFVSVIVLMHSWLIVILFCVLLMLFRYDPAN